jgi:hypothetical protein
MGYSYERIDGRNVLCCDNCGNPGARKRPCPYKVIPSTFKQGGIQRRASLPYCPAPALCETCWKKYGPGSTLHARCRVGARASQAKYDAQQAKLDSGAFVLSAGWGDWADNVPPGMVGALFENRTADEARYLIPAAEYEARGDDPTPEDFPGRQEWANA